MRVVKIKIKNLFGIKEYEAGGESLELSGKNGTGKTSVIDAIKYALTNKSDREYIVRNGETEGEILVEADNGLTINRKVRTNKADYKSVKSNGVEVGSPEAFLKDIFTTLQLNPVEFMAWDKNRKNAVILDMVEYDWDMQKIKEWFGEIPSWVSYDQNILSVLNDIQSEKGVYYQSRRDIDRDIRNKKAFVEEIASTIPPSYQVEKWENFNTGDLYKAIERINKENQTIERAKQLQDNRNNKIRKFDADREIEKSAIENEISGRSNQIDKEVLQLEERVKALKTEKAGLEAKKSDKLEIIEQTYKANVAKYDAEVAEYEEYLNKEPQDATELRNEVEEAEKMRAHINEYKRMLALQNEVETMQEESEELTKKIEKARTLPGEILANCTIPISGLTVENGIPLINGLPISNLSEGEQLDLCIDVALQKPNGLQIILIDGAEKLATDLRNQLYAKCKAKGLQYIATRTTDDDSLITAVEL